MNLLIDGKKKWFKPSAFFVAGGTGEEVEIDYTSANDAVSAYAIQAIETSGVLDNIEEVESAFGKGSKKDLFRIKHADIVTHEVTRGNLLTVLEDAKTVKWMQNASFSEVAEKYPDTSLVDFIKEANARKNGLVTVFELSKDVKPDVKRNTTSKRTW